MTRAVSEGLRTISRTSGGTDNDAVNIVFCGTFGPLIGTMPYVRAQRSCRQDSESGAMFPSYQRLHNISRLFHMENVTNVAEIFFKMNITFQTTVEAN